MKVLYITRELGHGKGGANVVIKRNLDLMNKISESVDFFSIAQPSIKTRLKNILFRESFGETHNLKIRLKKLLEDGEYDLIFFDGSYYGTFVKLAHSLGIKVACFYHNIEYIYYNQKFKLSHNPFDKLMSYYIRYNEGLSTRYSDYIITISLRDSNGLSTIYKRQANGILSTSFSKIDFLEEDKIEGKDTYILFIGTKFFANAEALIFIISKIAPFIDKNIVVVGDVCDILKGKEYPQNVILEGCVDDIDSYYKKASAILAPILSGSGLKTKSVEALRYGKTIIGSQEAFEGIPYNEFPSIGKICNTAQDYIDCINNFTFPFYNHESERAFNKYFSHEVQLKNLQNILSDLL